MSSHVSASRKEQIQEFEDVINSGPFPIRFPSANNLSQDREWCEILIEGKWRKIRFHDYAEVYEVPGLYETIFYRTLRCNSPLRVVGLLNQVLTEDGISPSDLRVLDFGAGNGMAGEALHTLGTRNVIGVDILPQAREAALRDRPWVYNDYLVADFLNLPDSVYAQLKEQNFNALTIIAALGFGDIPPDAFSTALSLIADEGWVAFNIKEEFLEVGTQSDFLRSIQRLVRERVIRIELYRRYRHRLSVSGEPLYYTAIVAKKVGQGNG